MKDLELQLQEILEKDPLGLLNVRLKSSEAMSPDKRLIASFTEVKQDCVAAFCCSVVKLMKHTHVGLSTK